MTYLDFLIFKQTVFRKAVMLAQKFKPQGLWEQFLSGKHDLYIKSKNFFKCAKIKYFKWVQILSEDMKPLRLWWE